MSGKFWYSANDSSLTISEKLITTKMACPGYNEKAFLKSLLLTTHYHLRNGILTLLGEIAHRTGALLWVGILRLSYGEENCEREKEKWFHLTNSS